MRISIVLFLSSILAVPHYITTQTVLELKNKQLQELNQLPTSLAQYSTYKQNLISLYESLLHNQTMLEKIIKFHDDELESFSSINQKINSLDIHKTSLKESQNLLQTRDKIIHQIIFFERQINRYNEQIDILKKNIAKLEQIISPVEPTIKRHQQERNNKAQELTQSWNMDLKKRSLEVIQELENEYNIADIFQALEYWEAMNKYATQKSS